MLELAGEIADGVILNFFPVDALPRIVEHVRVGAARAGRDVAASAVLPSDLEFRPLFDAIMSWAMGVDPPNLSTVDFTNSEDSDINWSVT